MTRTSTILIVPLLAVASVGCGRRSTGFQTGVVLAPDGRESRYCVFVPRNYNSGRPVPAILFLHGGGEVGTDGLKPTEVGLGPAVRAREATFPFLVVFPQATARSPVSFACWYPSQPDGARALAILEQVQRDYRIDPRRVYLTGISVGGNGVWHLAAAYPDRWAAIVPVCGLGSSELAAKLKDFPCWCFHGADDGVVPAAKSREMVEAIRRAGGAPRYTEYPGVGHNCWEKAYKTDELYEWLLAQGRDEPARSAANDTPR